MERRNFHHIIISAVLIILFAYTAVSKLFDFQTFERQMLNQPLPAWLNTTLIWSLPPLELLIAGSLIFTNTRRYGYIASIILMALFTGYVALIFFGYFNKAPCSCGGILQQLSWGEHLLINIALLVLSVIGFIKERKAGTKFTA